MPRAISASRAAAAAGADLRARKDSARATSMKRFFQAHPGGYGEGDKFLGLTVPQVRAVAREHRDLPPRSLSRLLASRVHEDRLLAVVLLVERAKRAKEPAIRDELARFYVDHMDQFDQWDLIDIPAPHVLGPYFASRSRAPLHSLARSTSVWRRRIAVLTTFHFIRNGEYSESVQLARALLTDEHDLIHKAVGWMLREVGDRDQKALRSFLDEHAARMPRTMLRYAIEKLPETQRRRYMAARGDVARRAPG